MKRMAAVVLLLTVLMGCSQTAESLDRAMALRAKLLGSGGCNFDAQITADYGESLCTFLLACKVDALGELSFTVKEPESIAGITGKISSEGGKLTFDDKALAFELLADGQIAPITAPWILVHTLQGGNIRSCTMDEDYLQVSIDDRFEDDPLRLEICLNGQDEPISCEMLYKNRRILAMEVRNFEIM